MPAPRARWLQKVKPHPKSETALKSRAMRLECGRAALVRLALSTLPAAVVWSPNAALAADKAYQPALEGKDYGKSQMSYDDFTKTDSGLAYKDAKLGVGQKPEAGDRVVLDWTGDTIGYFGRPFETKQLKALDNKDDLFLRFEVGSGGVIPALEQGVLGMAEGGVRQLVVPPNVGYPPNDPFHERIGPKPSTFSGQRALDFVLENKELIDKTLLFNVKLIRVDKPGANGWKAPKEEG